jgi:putative aldouronate transport system substrate-binding protein
LKPIPRLWMSGSRTSAKSMWIGSSCLAASITKKIKVLLNVGDIPDLVSSYDVKGYIDNYGPSGIFLDLNKYTEYMPYLTKYRKNYPMINALMAKTGQLYHVPVISRTDFNDIGWWANSAFLKKYGLSIPNTYNELLTVLRAAKVADKDSIPLLGCTYNRFFNLFSPLFDAQAKVIYYDTNAGAYKFAYREAAARRKELIEGLALLYKEGLIHPELATMSVEQENACYASGKWAFGVFWSFENTVFGLTDPSQSLPFEITPMSPPASPSGQRKLFLRVKHDSLPAAALFISSKAKEPQLLAAYVDFGLSDVAAELYEYGVEGVTFDRVNGIPVVKKGIDPTKMGTRSIVSLNYASVNSPLFITIWPTYNKGLQLFRNDFRTGKVLPVLDPVIPIFKPEQTEAKASAESALNTLVNENEIKFIYGLRSMSEWDSYVKSVESSVDINSILKVYNNAEIIKADTKRIWPEEK